MNFVIKSTTTNTTSSGGKVQFIDGYAMDANTVQKLLVMKGDATLLRYMFEDYIVTFINLTRGEFTAVRIEKNM